MWESPHAPRLESLSCQESAALLFIASAHVFCFPVSVALWGWTTLAPRPIKSLPTLSWMSVEEGGKAPLQPGNTTTLSHCICYLGGSCSCFLCSDAATFLLQAAQAEVEQQHAALQESEDCCQQLRENVAQLQEQQRGTAMALASLMQVERSGDGPGRSAGPYAGHCFIMSASPKTPPWSYACALVFLASHLNSFIIPLVRTLPVTIWNDNQP